MLSVSTAHAGSLVSVGCSPWSPEAAAAPEQRLRCLVEVLQRSRCPPRARAGAARRLRVGGQQGLCRCSYF